MIHTLYFLYTLYVISLLFIYFPFFVIFVCMIHTLYFLYSGKLISQHRPWYKKCFKDKQKKVIKICATNDLFFHEPSITPSKSTTLSSGMSQKTKSSSTIANNVNNQLDFSKLFENKLEIKKKGLQNKKYWYQMLQIQQKYNRMMIEEIKYLKKEHKKLKLFQKNFYCECASLLDMDKDQQKILNDDDNDNNNNNNNGNNNNNNNGNNNNNNNGNNNNTNNNNNNNGNNNNNNNGNNNNNNNGNNNNNNNGNNNNSNSNSNSNNNGNNNDNNNGNNNDSQKLQTQQKLQSQKKVHLTKDEQLIRLLEQQMDYFRLSLQMESKEFYQKSKQMIQEKTNGFAKEICSFMNMLESVNKNKYDEYVQSYVMRHFILAERFDEYNENIRRSLGI